jgi:hypothetical protein
MLWVATLWEEVVPREKVTEDLDDMHAGSEELAEMPCLCCCRPDTGNARFWMSWAAASKSVVWTSLSLLMLMPLDTLLENIIYCGALEENDGRRGEGGRMLDLSVLFVWLLCVGVQSML